MQVTPSSSALSRSSNKQLYAPLTFNLYCWCNLALRKAVFTSLMQSRYSTVELSCVGDFVQTCRDSRQLVESRRDRRCVIGIRKALAIRTVQCGDKFTTLSCEILMLVFTVQRSLHGICYSNSVRPSVRPSVCPSVCHTRGLCPYGSTYDHDFFTTG